MTLADEYTKKISYNTPHHYPKYEIWTIEERKKIGEQSLEGPKNIT